MRWIIVSNRLPFGLDENGALRRSSGGLVTALSGVHTQSEQLWVGIAPAGLDEVAWAQMSQEYRESYFPVFVDEDRYDRYYNGISNDVFWPLCHYESSLVKFDPLNWQAYQDVNARIAETIAEIAQPDDLIWIHDFHLFLLPQLLRAKDLKVRIGFFLHIPFPSSELFRQLPVRQEILRGLLGADLLGFHDYSYLRHFCNTLLNVLNLDSNMLGLTWQGREVALGVYPVSIDVAQFKASAKGPETRQELQRLQASKTYPLLILGVDRLDYSKGLPLKVQAFQALLETYPEFQGQVTLLQIAVPTRQDVEAYQKLRSRFEQKVGEINGRYGRPNYVPVQYMYSSVGVAELLALYQLADVLLVTSRRDGMNLVALEYIVCQPESRPGVVVLSEFTGASSMLSEVLSVNPWDVNQTAERLAEALRMPLAERQRRNRAMLQFLEGYTATDWAQSFMDDLLEIKGTEKEPSRLIDIKLGQAEFMTRFLTQIQKPGAGRLLIFLDYDGTLVPIRSHPQEAQLSTSAYGLLATLLRQPRVELVIISGRDATFLEEQFQGLAVSLAAEHGAKYFDHRRGEWSSQIWSKTESWYPSAETIMEDYSRRVPRSFVERKEYSIAWHYRLAPAEFALYQSRKLKEELEIGLSNLPVTIISGHKVIEARAVEANKGYFVRNYLDGFSQEQDWPVLMALGDDRTDEDMMQALPPEALTIKVGAGPSAARYRLRHQSEVLQLLHVLAEL